ncbi:hypothetical protein RDI58_020225 [Solanum bulbocastanum]|uniref:Uncharacterized protein n=1 Tax=Solanum bulbocastanum TaxID=147425 RepID=A0AAN8T6S5_SOLBU
MFSETHHPIVMVVSDHPSQPFWSSIALDRSIDIEFEMLLSGGFQLTSMVILLFLPFHSFSIIMWYSVAWWMTRLGLTSFFFLASVITFVLESMPLVYPIGCIDWVGSNRGCIMAGGSHMVPKCERVGTLEEDMAYVFGVIVTVVTFRIHIKASMAVFVENSPLLTVKILFFILVEFSYFEVVLTFWKEAMDALAYRSTMRNPFISYEVDLVPFMYSPFHCFLDILPTILDIFPSPRHYLFGVMFPICPFIFIYEDLISKLVRFLHCSPC